MKHSKHPLRVGDFHRRRKVIATTWSGSKALYRCEGEGQWREIIPNKDLRKD